MALPNLWMMSRCRVCGARLNDEVEWCVVCHAPVREPVDPPAHARARGTRWAPPEHTVAPPPAKVFSRTRGGPLSFGPLGRGLVTLLCAAAFLWFWNLPILKLAPLPLRIPFAFLPGLVLAGLVREVWKRARVE